MLFAFTAAVGFLLVNVVDPYSGATASPTYTAQAPERFGGLETQSFVVSDVADVKVARDDYTVKEKPKPKPKPKPAPVLQAASSGSDSGSSSGSDSGSSSAPAASAPDPGSAKAYAYSALKSRGMGDDQYSCLVSLWNRESGWNVHASNSSSGAYGIPQALPGSKMASAGPDWQNNAATQVNWGLGYIMGRYGSPCGAWAHSQNNGWY